MMAGDCIIDAGQDGNVLVVMESVSRIRYGG
jgi:hypothetical protein